jgi:hypothetical protein
MASGIWGIRNTWVDYLKTNSAARVPEGVDDCLKRMTITAMIAGDAGKDAAAPGLTNMPTSAIPVGNGAKKGILGRMKNR